MNRSSLSLPILTLSTALFLGSAGLSAQGGLERFQGEAREAWLTGKVETVLTLNEKLNPFVIDTDVIGDTVVLSGTVSSEVDKALAAELALGVSGVAEVENQLQVTGEPGIVERSTAQLRESGDNLMQWVSDATTTATIKTRLLADAETEGLTIDVDTSQDVVTLRGEVASEAERMLAEQIALNSVSDREVVNQLMVKSQ